MKNAKIYVTVINGIEPTYIGQWTIDNATLAAIRELYPQFSIIWREEEDSKCLMKNS